MIKMAFDDVYAISVIATTINVVILHKKYK